MHEIEEGVVQNQEHITWTGRHLEFYDGGCAAADRGSAGLFREHMGFDRALSVHQPNPFILKQMADKMKIPGEKLPNNIVSIYGNCSSVTIPLNIAHNCGEAML